MNIEKKNVLVTGSTDGVGRLVARRLADQGARVLIHGRDRTRSEQLVKEIRAADRGSAAFLPADFSSLAEVRRLADTVRQECDRLDILCLGIEFACEIERKHDLRECSLRSSM